MGQAVASILVADCGSSVTRVSLLERVETGYGFVAHAFAPTTDLPPWSDLSVGVRYAIEQISQTSKRALLDDNGDLIIPEVGGQGTDLFVLTCSAGQPLQVVLAGLVSQISIAALEQAAASSYVKILDVIARDQIEREHEEQPRDVVMTDGLMARWRSQEPQVVETSKPLTDEDKIDIIRQHRPDVVWVAGGTDGGSRGPVCDLVEMVALACTLVDSSSKPAIFYAGNAELRSEIVDLIGEEIELQVVDNVRPSLDTENLAAAQAAVQSAYVQRKVQRLPGIGNLIGWSGAPVIPTAQALGYLAMYLERLYESGKGVLCADVGSSNTVIATSFPDVKPSRNGASENDRSGRQTLHVATDLGVGYGAPALLERVGMSALARWLPFEPEPGEVEQILLNKGLRPMTIPQDRRELLIEQAAAREALRLVLSQARQYWHRSIEHAPRRLMPLLDPIIATGGILIHAPRPSQVVLMLLDAVEPVGVTTLVLDHHNVASALGAVAVTQPIAAVEALDAGALQRLGTVVAPVGRARSGEVVLRAKMAFERGGELEIEVKAGGIEVVPLAIGEKATVEFKLRRGFHLGRTGRTVEVSGGSVGLIIDARGRPLRLPANLERCHQLMQQWLWEMGA
jgi:hypothetical protein